MRITHLASPLKTTNRKHSMSNLTWIKASSKELADKKKFYAVRSFLGSIQWQSGQNFCPDTLYLESSAKITDLVEPS